MLVVFCMRLVCLYGSWYFCLYVSFHPSVCVDVAVCGCVSWCVVGCVCTLLLFSFILHVLVGACFIHVSAFSRMCMHAIVGVYVSMRSVYIHVIMCESVHCTLVRWKSLHVLVYMR